MGAPAPDPTYAAPAGPMFAQGPVGTFATDPQGMGTTVQPQQPKVLPTETAMDGACYTGRDVDGGRELPELAGLTLKSHF